MVGKEGKAADRAMDSLVLKLCRGFPLVKYKAGLAI